MGITGHPQLRRATGESPEITAQELHVKERVIMRRIVSVFVLSLCGMLCQAQTITPVPADGESTITVTFGALAAAKAVELYSPANAAAGAACAVNPANAVALKAGVPTTAAASSTSIVLVTDSPLQAGTPLCAALAGGPSGTVVLVKAPAAPPGFDWGHVRAYFTAGALMSQEHDQFSHQDLFLAFRLDKSYWMEAMAKKDGTYEPGLRTYFDTRLTALPVAVQSCAPAQTSSGSGSSGTSPTCSSSTSSSSGGSSTDPTTTTQAFLNSQKTATLDFAAFYPIYFPHWGVVGKTGKQPVTSHYALFLAPLVEAGFDTTLNGLNQTQQQSGTSSQVQPVGTSSQFYKFYDFGFRLGHDQLFTDSSAAPDEISYLNVAFGRFSNMASLLCPTSKYQGSNTCGAPSGTLPWQRDWRTRVEGLLQVPGTGGFSVGFGANVGLHGTRQANIVHIEPADDLRFLFGYKFDITKIASKLAPQHF
jgi:hypothetical protein